MALRMCNDFSAIQSVDRLDVLTNVLIGSLGRNYSF
ncbi:MAG: hypothetical protein CM15mP4_1820 [Candidatus Neomarinimicrobiota bacterium]|nr:MAG: hypothetical protein CM15mP4_1820 [Candidatus Neomarinimicrobiota bacterium]